MRASMNAMATSPAKASGACQANNSTSSASSSSPPTTIWNVRSSTSKPKPSAGAARESASAAAQAISVHSRRPSGNERPARHGGAGTAKRRKYDQQRVFGDPVEHERRDQRRAQAADHAARRHPQIKRGQVFGGRAALGKLAVAGERDHEERREVDRYLRQDVRHDRQHQGGDEGH